MDLSIDKENTRTEASELIRPHRSSIPRRWITRPRGWRVTILAGACLTCLVLLLNIGLLIWAYHTALDIHDGILTVYRGDCLEMKKILTWSHLGINVLSTLLLGASTACMQCVSMPTRKEVDEAHEQGLWLHLGVLGFRNFLHISNWRRVIWILLAFSSVPIHLLYNSIIFSTESSSDYNAFIVTPDFLTGGMWNVSDENNFGDAYFTDYKDHWQIQDLQDHVNLLTRLDTANCVREFSPSSISGWRNVLVVTNSTNEANSLLYSTTHEADVGYDSKELICQEDKDSCYIYSDITINADGTHWQVTLKKYHQESDLYKYLNVSIESCLAQKIAPACTIDLSSPVLITVILCNLVKLFCLIISSTMSGFQPLITTGDAIASFLTRPDATTVGYGPVSAVEIMRINSRQLKTRSYEPLARPWKPVMHFWFAAASRRRWAVVLTCCFAAWTSSLVLLLIYGGIPSPRYFQIWWARGLGGRGSNDLVTISQNQSIGSNILLANTPQLLISLIYILYNGAFTSMLLTDEILGFATKRKPLRVSQPSGAQRSTYWLQLPYRYAIPLMTAISLLHWLISQSLFLIRIAVLDSVGWEDPSRGVYGCGWSPLALFFSTLLGGLLIINLVANGFRRYTDKMPILSSCSLAISAACHRGPFEDEDMPVVPLQYGVLSVNEGSEAKIGFSGREVRPYVKGVAYGLKVIP